MMVDHAWRPRSVDEVLAHNIALARWRRVWHQQFQVGGDEMPPHGPAGRQARDELEQAHVAARMRTLGHRWVQQTVSEVERARRRVTAAELVSLTEVLGTTIAELLDPHDQALAIDRNGDVQVEREDVEALVCGHKRRAVVEWHGAELAGVQFKEADQ
jgi:transcriptional regulator with XRE-family HTH domain